MGYRNDGITATLSEQCGACEIVATAEKTGDQTPTGYGWWIAHYSVADSDFAGSRPPGTRIAGHFLTADAALDAALHAAQHVIERGAGVPPPDTPPDNPARQ